jgi:hypothetical protein
MDSQSIAPLIDGRSLLVAQPRDCPRHNLRWIRDEFVRFDDAAIAPPGAVCHCAHRHIQPRTIG